MEEKKIDEPTAEEKQAYLDSIDWYEKLVKDPSLFEKNFMGY